MARTLREAEVRIFYSVSGFQHTLSYGVKFSMNEPPSGTDPLVVLKDTTTKPAGDTAGELALLLAPLLNDTDSISGYEVWDLKNESLGTGQARFVHSNALGVLGQSPFSANKVRQDTIMYRSLNGKVGRLVMLGAINDVTYARSPRPFPTVREDIANWMEGDTSPILHPDGSYVSSVYAWTNTTNNAMERRIYGRG